MKTPTIKSLHPSQQRAVKGKYHPAVALRIADTRRRLELRSEFEHNVEARRIESNERIARAKAEVREELGGEWVNDCLMIGDLILCDFRPEPAQP